MDNEASFLWKLLIALCAGVFGVAVAISIQHIKIIGVPKWLVVFAIMVQLILSWGVFIFVMIFFKSGLLPEGVPNDEYSALSVAYFSASIPHIIITTAILIYNKEINKWLESRYGSGEVLPNMDSVAQNEVSLENEVSLRDEVSLEKDNHSDETTQECVSETSLENVESSLTPQEQSQTHNDELCQACGKAL